MGPHWFLKIFSELISSRFFNWFFSLWKRATCEKLSVHFGFLMLLKQVANELIKFLFEFNFFDIFDWLVCDRKWFTSLFQRFHFDQINQIYLLHFLHLSILTVPLFVSNFIRVTRCRFVFVLMLNFSCLSLNLYVQHKKFSFHSLPP